MVKTRTTGIQTADKSKRWKEHSALYLRYAKHHRAMVLATTPLLLSEAYKLIFVKRPQPKQLEIRENYWISKLDAAINIAKTYMPKYK